MRTRKSSGRAGCGDWAASGTIANAQPRRCMTVDPTLGRAARYRLGGGGRDCMRFRRLGMAGVGMLLGLLLGWIARGWTEHDRAEQETRTQVEEEAAHEEPVIDERAVLEPDELARLLSQARTAASRTPLGRAELMTLAQIEDHVYGSFEVAWRTWDNDRQDPILGDRKQAHEDLYKAVLQLSDAAVERYFTPEIVESVPWRDLLADPSAWKTSEPKGFESKLENGVLHLVGPARTADAQGIASIGDGEDWR